jgi:hypothetical protein
MSVAQVLTSGNKVAQQYLPTGTPSLFQFGSVTANSAVAVPVANTNVTPNTVIQLTLKTAVGANAGQAYVSSVTDGVGFSIVSGVADTSVYNYVLINPSS